MIDRPGEERATATATAERVAPGIIAMGPPDAPAIVFLHGTRLSRAAWTPQLETLSDEFRTIAIDLPGHGDRASERFELAGAVELVAAAIRDQAADERAVVVGLSLGGYVAMALAGEQPALVRGLVVAGASAEPIGLRLLPYRALTVLLTRFDGPRLDGLNARFFRMSYPPAIADPIVAGGFWSAGGAEAVRALFNQRFMPRLAAYPGPSLILNGELDLLFRWSAGRFAATAAHGRRVRLAGARHLSNLDRPAAFSLAVRDFARSVEPA